MFRLAESEFAASKSQFVTSSCGGIRCPAPYAFTEQGVARGIRFPLFYPSTLWDPLFAKFRKVIHWSKFVTQWITFPKNPN
jgi:hypothetical protein